MGCTCSCIPRVTFCKPLLKRPAPNRCERTDAEQLKQRLSFPFSRDQKPSGAQCGLVDVCFTAIQDFLGTPPRFRIITYEDDPFTWNFSARMNYASRHFLLNGHKDYVIVVATRGHLVVTGSNDETAKVWDAGSGVLKQTLPCGSAVSAIDIEHDVIATGTRLGVVQCWKQGDSMIRKEERSTKFGSLWLRETDATLLAMRLRSDVLLTGGRDAVVRVWNTSTGVLQQAFQKHRCAIWALAIHPNLNFATSASSDCVYLWNTFHGNVVHKLKPGIDGGPGTECCNSWRAWKQAMMQHMDPCVAVDMAGEFIATGSVRGVIRIWNRKSGSLIRLMALGTSASPLGSRNALNIRADGTLVSCWRSGRIDIWDAGCDNNSPQFTITSGFPSSWNAAQSYTITFLT